MMKSKKVGLLTCLLIILLVVVFIVLVFAANKNKEVASKEQSVEYSSDKLAEINKLLDITGIYYCDGSYSSNSLNSAVNKLISDDKESEYEVLKQNVIMTDKYLVDSVEFIGGSTHTYVINNIELEAIAKKYNITNIDSLFDANDIEITDNVIETSIDTDGNTIDVYEKKYKFVHTENSIETGGYYTYKNTFNIEYKDDSVNIVTNNCVSSNLDTAEECTLYTYVFKSNKNNEFYLAEVKSVN